MINKLENEIKRLVNEGFTYPQIDNKLKITRSGDIARSLGIKRSDKDSKFWVSIVKDINRDIKRGLPYEDLKLKYDFDTFKDKYVYHGLSPITYKYRNVRDKEITKQYKKKIARIVLGSDAIEMDSPERLSNVAGIYRSSSRNGFVKYPIIKRGVKGLFVEKAVIKLIKSGKDKGKTNQEISDLLNKRGFISPMGYPYKHHMISFKWAKIKKLKL